LENPLDDEIDVERIAFVAQEKRFLTVANENETVVWNDMGDVRSKFRRHLSMLQYATSIDARHESASKYNAKPRCEVASPAEFRRGAELAQSLVERNRQDAVLLTLPARGCAEDR
jgi:hypothetical protein